MNSEMFKVQISSFYWYLVFVANRFSYFTCLARVSLMYVICLCQVFREEIKKMLKLRVCYSLQYGSCFCLVFWNYANLCV